MHYLYVLKSRNKIRRYIGIAANVEKRLLSHNSGKVRSTKAYMPWEIVYTEEYGTKNEAAYREQELKHNSWKRNDLFTRLNM